ncbi:MAG: DUF4249 domain-containing protein [Hymenobacteraceae bacterium]|nr:DUF4249 domain-containing protein [Hymenobacteraceae bacterium]
MSRNIYTVLWVGLLLLNLPLLSSCEEVVSDVDIPEPKKKLAVFSFLNPQDTVVVVSVSKTVPTLGKLNNGTPDYVSNATVTITEGAQNVTLEFDPVSNVYKTKELQVVPGATYHLQVSTPDGFKVKSVCTVPAKLNTALTATLDSVPTDNTGVNPHDYIVRAKWQDLPGSGDFYKIDAEFEAGLPSGGKAFEALEMDMPVHTDETGDGKQMKTQSYPLYSLRESFLNKNLKSINVYFLTTDQHYYKYHESLVRFQYENTFSEPVLVYSNIEGGVGVFCAYRLHSLKLQP